MGIKTRNLFLDEQLSCLEGLNVFLVSRNVRPIFVFYNRQGKIS